MLREVSQTEKDKYHMILPTRKSLNSTEGRRKKKEWYTGEGEIGKMLVKRFKLDRKNECKEICCIHYDYGQS